MKYGGKELESVLYTDFQLIIGFSPITYSYLPLFLEPPGTDPFCSFWEMGLLFFVIIMQTCKVSAFSVLLKLLITLPSSYYPPKIR